MIPAAQCGAVLALLSLVGGQAPFEPPPAEAPVPDARVAQPVSVALDLSALDEASYRRIGGLALEKQAVLRLVQETFAVQAPGGAPDILVLLEVQGGALRLTARSKAAIAAREIALGSNEALQELHLETSQKIVELARAVTPPAAPPAPATPPAKPPPAPDEAPAPVPPAAPRWWTVDAAAGVDLAFRKGGNDWQGRLALRWGGRLGVRLTGALAPSQTGELTLLDWTVLGGPSLRVGLFEAVSLEVDVLGGALLHHYTFHTPFVSNRSGDRADWAVAVPVTLVWESASGITFALRVAGRVTGRSREHLLNQTVIWRREAWALETGLLLGKRF